MPALTVFKNFTTKPLAGDDFQIVCVVLSFYRAIQLVCLIPLIVNSMVERFNGTDLIVNGKADYCPQWHEAFDNREDYLVGTVDEYRANYDITRSNFGRWFLVTAGVYAGVDIGWILAVWGCASIGTPTQPRGRDEYLRSLIFLKFAINAFPIALLVLGCMRVFQLRDDNYGCGEGITLRYYPDETWDYALYCILLVTYALELFIWPSIAANRIIRFLRSNKLTQKERYATEAKGERLDQCLGGILKCVSILCCNKAGGKEIKNQGEMKDFASNLMEFANNETKVGVVLSDMYVGGKLLARVQAERRMRAIQMLQSSSNKRDEKQDTPDEVMRSSADRRALLDSKDVRRRRSILTLQADGDGKDCVVVEKNVLTNNNEGDVNVLRNAAHYSIYAQWVYFHIKMVVEDLLANPNPETWVRDFEVMAPVERFSLARFEAPNAHLFYSNLKNGIAATPYAIMVDEYEKSVVIAVRGTISLEDWVIDLQYVPQPLDKVGDLCGFNGQGHHCHKGVLTRCKWMYNDIKKQRVLKHLYSSESPYKEHDLVVVGHSLGGGCAQVLSLMLRPSFPSLRCYAFEPPGCIFDDVLSEDCKQWITSIVRHEDVVPRVTQPNLESLRDEFFDVVARIKVPKIKVFHDVRSPCPDSHLASRNKAVLCPKGEIERDTVFYQQVQKFRNERAEKNKTGEVSVKLYIPGNIIHLVDTMGDEKKYVAYWASRYEFNQVVLSGRMLADHAIPPLVGILRNLNLDDVHEVRTWHTDDKEEEEEEEIFSFIPFSNPQGKFPLILVAFTVVACVLAALSSRVCNFFVRSAVYSDGSPGLGLSTGLWSYKLKQCIDPENCDSNDPNDLEDSNYCQVYGQLFNTVDSYWTASRVFSALSALFGIISLGIISTATCTKVKRRTWIVAVALLLVATLFQGLQFLFSKSDLCNEWTHPETGVVIKGQCSLSTGGYYGITAAVLWFINAVGCSHMARIAS